MSKQTALQQFIDKITSNHDKHFKDFYKAEIEEALQMEREQIVVAFISGGLNWETKLNNMGNHNLKTENNNANVLLPAVYFAVYVDGDYKQIVTVKADSEEQAERRLIDAGWNAPVIFEQMVFDIDNVCVLFNGR